MDALAAGLLSFIIDNNATILVAGTRSSGKSSLLGSFLVEMSRRSRIITIEDTFELPQEAMRALGYNIENMKVAGALASPGSEVDPSIGIRSTLRLGDSAIFVGEVRSKEAIALFEAMRVGAAANVVAGTIHADSPYGVYDRVVNDIGVPKTSFKAIDIIVTTNPVISGLKKYKRVLRITEVRKKWEEDPLAEGAFVDLMVYNPKTDQMEITDDLINGNSEILKRMAGKVKEFAGDWDAVWNNIQLRADYKQAINDIAIELNDPTILEAEFVVTANDMFKLISDKNKEKYGNLDPSRILFEFKEWLRKEAKKIN
jgi:type IV secretory pathway ATPase VirB11/archaellum biosynthesis ATPase